jgi:hypothetical protein
VSSPSSVGRGNVSTGLPGSRSGQEPCPRGYFCAVGGLPQLCPAGRFGGETGLMLASCSGPCADGSVCEPGSTESSGVGACPRGYFCTIGNITACPAGRYNDIEGAATDASCVACPSGTFNAATGVSMMTSACVTWSWCCCACRQVPCDTARVVTAYLLKSRRASLRMFVDMTVQGLTQAPRVSRVRCTRALLLDPACAGPVSWVSPSSARPCVLSVHVCLVSVFVCLLCVGLVVCWCVLLCVVVCCVLLFCGV